VNADSFRYVHAAGGWVEAYVYFCPKVHSQVGFGMDPIDRDVAVGQIVRNQTWFANVKTATCLRSPLRVDASPCVSQGERRTMISPFCRKAERGANALRSASRLNGESDQPSHAQARHFLSSFGSSRRTRIICCVRSLP
jgi:hypothetical protein